MPEGGTKTPLTGIESTVFGTNESLFSPGAPLVPPQGQRPVRGFDFRTGINQVWTPRSYEPFSFHQLRSFSNVELVRLAIETRKDQMERLDWVVRTKINRKPRADADERIAKATKLLNKPDGLTPFASWNRQLVEDLLSIDAMTIERRRNRRGDLIGLEIVDGSTIKVLIDDNGRLPRAPVPGYEQVIKGTVWNLLTTDDIIYAPRNLRPGHMYGFGPVEQVIVTIQTLINRQTAQLAHFTAGNVPAGIVSVPDAWTPDQIAEFKDWMDSKLSGNLEEKSKLVPVPHGTQVETLKDAPLKDDFDEWLARVICYAFSIPPTPFIKQMNRGTAQEDQDRAMEEGLSPLLNCQKRVYDSVIQDDLGFNELEFAWLQIRDIDIEKQARVHDIYLKNGTLSINNVLDDLGKPQIGADGDQHVIYTGTGAVPLDTLEDAAQADIDAANAPPAGRAVARGTTSRPKATSSSPSPQRPKPQTQ